MNAARARHVGALGALALLVATFAWYAFGSGSSPYRTLRADFAGVDGLYTGAQVKILGVPVGTVTAIKQRGSYVEVDLRYQAAHPLPAGVGAVIVQPSVVGDRYVQLTPAYAGGAQLADGAHLALSRTAVPVTLDQTYSALNKLAAALGPSGANHNGALRDTLTVLAHNLAGNGQLTSSTLSNLATLMADLSDKRSDLSGTVDNLAVLSTALAKDDPQVRALATNLALVSQQIDAQRGNLTAALNALQPALAQVSAFVKSNRSALTTSVSQLATVAQTVASQRSALDYLLKVAPLAVSNLDHAYNPQNWDPANPTVPLDSRLGALQSRGNFFNDLTIQIATALQGACANLNAAPAAVSTPLCTVLTGAGQSVGGTLQQILGGVLGGSPLAGAAAPASLADVLTGGTR